MKVQEPASLLLCLPATHQWVARTFPGGTVVDVRARCKLHCGTVVSVLAHRPLVSITAGAFVQPLGTLFLNRDTVDPNGVVRPSEWGKHAGTDALGARQLGCIGHSVFKQTY